MFHNVYMQPWAYHEFMSTGVFPEGTMFLLSFFEPSQKSAPARAGYYEGDRAATPPRPPTTMCSPSSIHLSASGSRQRRHDCEPSISGKTKGPPTTVTLPPAHKLPCSKIGYEAAWGLEKNAS
jgi:hypothetical protein